MNGAILDKLAPAIVLAAAEGPATKAEIEHLLATAKILVPSDYLELVAKVTDAEFKVRGAFYIRIWGPARASEMNEAYSIQRYLPQSLAIGDDEGDRALILMSGKQGHGLYLVGFGELDSDEARYVAPSLFDLLVREVGLDVIA